jgi:hypothetical protein
MSISNHGQQPNRIYSSTVNDIIYMANVCTSSPSPVNVLTFFVLDHSWRTWWVVDRRRTDMNGR